MPQSGFPTQHSSERSHQDVDTTAHLSFFSEFRLKIVLFNITNVKNEFFIVRISVLLVLIMDIRTRLSLIEFMISSMCGLANIFWRYSRACMNTFLRSWTVRDRVWMEVFQWFGAYREGDRILALEYCSSAFSEPFMQGHDYSSQMERDQGLHQTHRTGATCYLFRLASKCLFNTCLYV